MAMPALAPFDDAKRLLGWSGKLTVQANAMVFRQQQSSITTLLTMSELCLKCHTIIYHTLAGLSSTFFDEVGAKAAAPFGGKLSLKFNLVRLTRQNVDCLNELKTVIQQNREDANSSSECNHGFGKAFVKFLCALWRQRSCESLKNAF